MRRLISCTDFVVEQPLFFPACYLQIRFGFDLRFFLDATSCSAFFQTSHHWHGNNLSLTSPQSLIGFLPFVRSLSTCHSDSSAMVMEVDHDRQLVFCETLPYHSSSPASPSRTTALSLLGALQPSDEQVAARLSAPVVATQLDTRNISFER